MKTKRTSVVILNWNGQEFLKRFLPFILSHTDKTNTEIIVADNGSTDDSLSLLKAHFPDVIVVPLEKNYGFSEGYNKVLMGLESEYFVLLNSDIETTQGWLEPLITFMDKHPDVGVCQPKLLSYFERDKFEYAGAAGGFIDRWGYPFCRGRLFQTLECDKGQYDTTCDIFWATGACMVVRASLYKELGGLDNDFFAHMEEIDFCWRVKNAGFRVVCHPQTIVYHWGGGTLPKSNPRKTFLNFRNNLWLLFKNLPGNRLLPVYLLRIFLDIVAALKFFSEGNASDMLAVFKAHFVFLFSLPALRKKRKTNKIARTSEMFQESIVWNYYVMKRKTFNELPPKFSGKN